MDHVVRWMLFLGWMLGTTNMVFAQEPVPLYYYPPGEYVVVNNPYVANPYVINPYVYNPYVAPYGYAPYGVDYTPNYYPYGPAQCEWMPARWEGDRWYPPQKVCSY